MDENSNIDKKHVFYACILALLVLCSATYFVCRRTVISDVRQSVERAEQYNRQTGESVDSAANEIGCADEKLDRAESSIGRSKNAIERSIDAGDRNKKELEECQRIVSECQADVSKARGILESVRNQGKETGARTDSKK